MRDIRHVITHRCNELLQYNNDNYKPCAIQFDKWFSFFDYDITFTKLLNHLFWSMSAIKIDNVDTIATDVNKYIYVKVETGDHTYLYKDVITQLDKTITNNDFTITTMTLKTAGKIE